MFEKEKKIENIKKEIKDLDIYDMNNIIQSYCKTPEITLNMSFVLEQIIMKFAKDTNEIKTEVEENYQNTVYRTIELLESKPKLVFNDIFGMIPYLYNSYVVVKQDAPIIMDFKPKFIEFMKRYGLIENAQYKSHKLYNLMYKELLK